MLLSPLLSLISLSHALIYSSSSLAKASPTVSYSSSTFPVTFPKNLPRYLLPWNSSWQLFDEALEDGTDADTGISEEDYEYDYEEEKEATKTKRDKNSKNKNDGHQCVRKNRSGVIRSSPPSFRLPEDEMQQLSAGHLGHRVELFCPHRKGCPRARVEWQKDGQVLTARGRKSGLSTLRIKHNGELIIEDNRMEDDGIYTCVISNQFGSIQHSVRVQSVPRAVAMEPDVHKNQPGNHTVVVGSNLTLLCQLTVVDVSSPYHIIWYKHYTVNGSWLDSEGKVYATSLQDSQSSPPPPDDQKLQLSNLGLNDTGWFSCAISNQYGRLLRSGWVEVVEMMEEEQGNLTNPLYTYLAVGIGGVIGLGLTCMLGIMFFKYRKEKKQKTRAVETAQCVVRWTKKIIIERNILEEAGVLESLTPIVRVEKILAQSGDWDVENDDEAESYEFQLDVEWEFPRELLELGEELGQGAFGQVVRGTAYKCRVKSSLGSLEDVGCPLVVCSDSSEEPITVAVKMLKENHSEEDVLDLVKEIEIMKVVGGHVNIVNLLAACTQPSGQPLLAIMEFAEFGNLRDYLRTRRGLQAQADPQNSGRPISLREMLSFAWQVGRGMEFLSGRRCVHRDLAARNVLVSRGGVVKIADFGLARDIEESDYYRKIGEAKLPVLWMSPESLFDGVSTTMSDVWSFGVLLWEIVTCGERPYSGVATEAVLDLIKDGYRMSIPPQCPQHLYLIMRDCWQREPSSRPLWSGLVLSLLSLYHQTLPGVYLELALPYIPTPPSSPESSSSLASQNSPSTSSTSVYYPGYIPGIAPLVTPHFIPSHQPPPLLPTQPLPFQSTGQPPATVPSLPVRQVNRPGLVRRMSEESGYDSNTGGRGSGLGQRYYNVLLS
eukprot:GFUD01045005.1.p1 GENE.GFUD01045005.1~~GFUD01045005.1.p1  ORF type:complete len:884 (-),score=253.97 GFUD01045005.1:246-2897(-)